MIDLRGKRRWNCQVRKALDAIIPRGGAGLRKVVQEQAKMPILCRRRITHVDDDDVEIPLAQNIVVNPRCRIRRPPTRWIRCWSIRELRARLSALILRLLDEFKIDIYGCPKTVS